MNVREIKITDLIPAPYNPRAELKPGDPGYEKLARSLAEFDLVEPLVWNERTGHVVGGHQRLTILKSRGDRTAPCVVVDLDDARERALNVALNNESVGGDWEPEKLVDLLADLAERPEIDATLTGFDEDELADLLMAPPDGPLGPEPTEEGDDLVRVSFTLAPDRWEPFRPVLDAFLAEHDLRPHITLPDV